MYSVVVGNIGCIFTGNRREALLLYHVYVDHSTDNHSSRCYGENVTLLQDNSILKEHIGHIEQESTENAL